MFLINPPIKTRVFVVFERSVNPRWYQTFLKPEFQHCYAMIDAGDSWLVIAPAWELLTFELRGKWLFPTVRDYAGDYATIVDCKVSIRPGKCVGFVGLFSCVAVVKGVLGVSDFFVWTPYQLYKRIKADG